MPLRSLPAKPCVFLFLYALERKKSSSDSEGELHNHFAIHGVVGKEERDDSAPFFGIASRFF